MSDTGGGTSNEISGGEFFSAVIQARDVGQVSLRLPARVPEALSGLPVRTASFTGRGEVLEELLGCLAPDRESDAVVVAAVGGMGGIGKTELAIQAARAALARGWFPGGVLFADMRGYDPDPTLRGNPGQALEGFLRAVGVPGEHVPPTVEDRSRLLRSLLAAYVAKGRRVLVVVDNVSTSGQAAPLLPSDGVCAAIVTSRHVLADLDARLLNLDTLPTWQAVELLEAALRLRDPTDTRVSDYPDDARRLVGLCAGLPLAVQIVAAHLAASPSKHLAAMAADLSEAASRLEELAFADRAVHAVFDTSYHQLSEDQARLFRLLSLNPGPDISTHAIAALTSQTEVETRRSLEALARIHLIKSGSSYGRWRMHDLLRLHSTHHGTAEADTDQRDQALTRLLDYYLSTTRAAAAYLDPEIADPASHGFQCQDQALAWLDAEYPNLISATYTAAHRPAHHTIARDLPHSMGHFLMRRRHFNDWITLSETSLATARTHGDRHGEGLALEALGLAMQGAERFEEAITAYQDAAAIFHQFGNAHGECRAMTSLGEVFRRGRQFVRAIAACSAAAAIARTHSAPHLEAGAVISLGHALQEQGQHEGAITTYATAATIARTHGDPQLEAVALINLGNTLRETRRIKEAMTTYTNASMIARTHGYRYLEEGALTSLTLMRREAQWQERCALVHAFNARFLHELGYQHPEAQSLSPRPAEDAEQV